jgi:hypothetical protein
MKKIILIVMGLSIILFADFTKSGNIVTDNSTKLQWQDTADNNTTQKEWREAINYCENLTLDGYNDWRLPNINELNTLVNINKTKPAIDSTFEYVGGTIFYPYWSSTTSARTGNEDEALFVAFNYGLVGADEKIDTEKYVRCVRGGD